MVRRTTFLELWRGMEGRRWRRAPSSGNAIVAYVGYLYVRSDDL